VTAKAFEYGLIIERSGPQDEVIKCLMPLTIGLDEIEEGLDILERAIVEEFSDELVNAPSNNHGSTELPPEQEAA
jgi:diaminobutyrate-2-oxoglutarate transaminase